MRYGVGYRADVNGFPDCLRTTEGLKVLPLTVLFPAGFQLVREMSEAQAGLAQDTNGRMYILKMDVSVIIDSGLLWLASGNRVWPEPFSVR